MSRNRRRFNGKFNSKVAVEAIRGLRALSEIAKQFKVYPYQVTVWKKQLLEGADEVFESSSGSSKKKDNELEAAEIYEQIGRLKVEWSGSRKVAENS